MIEIRVFIIFVAFVVLAESFRTLGVSRRGKLPLRMNSDAVVADLAGKISQFSMNLADTSVSEEDVLEVTGEMTNLPDPIYAIAFGAIVFLGVAVLQFSLGDLNKQVRLLFLVSLNTVYMLLSGNDFVW